MSGAGTASEPLISIVIPTRERAAKLQYTLKTVLSQPGDGFEVIVSDNASGDETRSVVGSLTSDSRLRHLNTGDRLSMRDDLFVPFLAALVAVSIVVRSATQGPLDTRQDFLFQLRNYLYLGLSYLVVRQLRWDERYRRVLGSDL